MIPDQPTLLELAHSLEEQRWKHMLAAALPALEHLLSVDLQFIHSSGLKDDKTRYLAALAKGDVVYDSAKSTIETAIPLGDEAFMAQGVVQMKATVRGAKVDLHSLFMVVWKREKDVWRLVGHQTTLIKK